MDNPTSSSSSSPISSSTGSPNSSSTSSGKEQPTSPTPQNKPNTQNVGGDQKTEPRNNDVKKENKDISSN